MRRSPNQVQAGEELISLFRSPERAGEPAPRAWEQFIAVGREANLLGRLYWVIREAGALGTVPDGPATHLMSAWLAAEAQRRAVTREVTYLLTLLQDVASRVVLLKGAAYAFTGLPPAPGRQFSDIDILVSRDELRAVEAKLNWAGWLGTHHGAYDQRYYREWMHELPPLRHPQRGSTLDVHHTILPETARFHPDADALLSAARLLPGHSQLAVLAPEDMVIHSATHLFLDGEIPNGLRDLLDLDALLRHFGASPAFWDALPARAQELELALPLFLALRYCQRLLGTPVPDSCRAAMAGTGPHALAQRVLDACYRRLLVPALPEHSRRPGHRAAGSVIFLRGHWLRMPLPLLVRHVVQKGVVVPLFGDHGTPQPWAR